MANKKKRKSYYSLLTVEVGFVVRQTDGRTKQNTVA